RSSGGLIGLDAGSAGSAGLAADAACSSFSETAKTTLEPADIVWGIDNSGSMSEETAAIQANMNAFAQQIIASGIDVHVVLISDGIPPKPAPLPFIKYFGVCIAPPLGSGQPCPND